MPAAAAEKASAENSSAAENSAAEKAATEKTATDAGFSSVDKRQVAGAAAAREMTREVEGNADGHLRGYRRAATRVFDPVGQENTCGLMCILELLVTAHLQHGMLGMCGLLLQQCPEEVRNDVQVLRKYIELLSTMSTKERHSEMMRLKEFGGHGQATLRILRRLVQRACEGSRRALDDELHVSAADQPVITEAGARIHLGAIVAFLEHLPMRVAILTALGDGHVIRRETGGDGMPYVGALLARHHHLVCLIGGEPHLEMATLPTIDLQVCK